MKDHGKAYQESLGSSDSPDGCYMYVYISPMYGHTILTRHKDQVAAAIEGFFWPKIFFDFLTKNLDGAVKPVPVLQVINLLFGFVMLAWEWPLWILAGSSIHRSIEARLIILPLSALAAALMYQTTNPAIYYMVGMGVYFWAYSEGEVSLHSYLKYIYNRC